MFKRYLKRHERVSIKALGVWVKKKGRTLWFEKVSKNYGIPKAMCRQASLHGYIYLYISLLL